MRFFSSAPVSTGADSFSGGRSIWPFSRNLSPIPADTGRIHCQTCSPVRHSWPGSTATSGPSPGAGRRPAGRVQFSGRRPLRRLDFGDHAPADPGRDRDALLPALPGALSRRRESGGGRRGRGPRSLVGPRLLPALPGAAGGGEDDRRRRRRPSPHAPASSSSCRGSGPTPRRRSPASPSPKRFRCSTATSSASSAATPPGAPGRSAGATAAPCSPSRRAFSTRPAQATATRP